MNQTTFATRKNIGFTNIRKQWKQASTVYTNSTLTICGHPVMESWEEPYMKLLAEIVSKNKGVILEIGFGMGISAMYIQQHNPSLHIIIEANESVSKKAQAFSNQQKNTVLVLSGFWEEVTKHLPPESINGILFDTYPLSEDEIHSNHFPFFAEAFRLLKNNGILTYYSDEAYDFSEKHKEKLHAAGFTDIKKEVCQVEPPQSCLYWKDKTIVAPIVKKSL